MTTTFNDALRAQLAREVVNKIMRLMDAFAESTSGALSSSAEDGGPSEGLAELMRTNLEQFTAAAEATIDAWVAENPGVADTVAEKLHKGARVTSEALERLALRAMSEILKTRNGGAPVEVAAMTKREDVVKAVQVETERIMQGNPRITPAAARMAAWQNREDLAERYQMLPVETAPVVTAPVEKGADAVAKATARAREIQRSNPGMSLAAARTKVWELDPALADEFNRAMSA